MILILEKGKLTLISNHRGKNLLPAHIDVNTVFLQQVGKYYFGDGEIQVIPDVPAVVSLERGDSITQHLTIEAEEVNTYFNELYLPSEFSKDDLPFEFLRGIKDGYRLSNFHTRVWIFDKKFMRHFKMSLPHGFSDPNASLLGTYMEMYKTFSNLSDIAVFDIPIDGVYDNLQKFTGQNYDELVKWTPKFIDQKLEVTKISWRDLAVVPVLPANVDPRSAELKAKVPLPLTTAVPVIPAKEKPTEKAVPKDAESNSKQSKPAEAPVIVVKKRGRPKAAVTV